MGIVGVVPTLSMTIDCSKESDIIELLTLLHVLSWIHHHVMHIVHTAEFHNILDTAITHTTWLIASVTY